MHHSLQIMFILPLVTGHLFWKATILGGLYRGVPLYTPCPNHKCKQFIDFCIVIESRVGASTQILSMSKSTSTLLSMSTSTSTEKNVWVRVRVF